MFGLFLTACAVWVAAEAPAPPHSPVVLPPSAAAESPHPPLLASLSTASVRRCSSHRNRGTPPGEAIARLSWCRRLSRQHWGTLTVGPTASSCRCRHLPSRSAHPIIASAFVCESQAALWAERWQRPLTAAGVGGGRCSDRSLLWLQSRVASLGTAPCSGPSSLAEAVGCWRLVVAGRSRNVRRRPCRRAAAVLAEVEGSLQSVSAVIGNSGGWRQDWLQSWWRLLAARAKR